tara:strand:+ start:29994 stop:30194 length:201 start_codon:yes stop_codon:yes gene_type:complete
MIIQNINLKKDNPTNIYLSKSEIKQLSNTTFTKTKKEVSVPIVYKKACDIIKYELPNILMLISIED